MADQVKATCPIESHKRCFFPECRCRQVHRDRRIKYLQWLTDFFIEADKRKIDDSVLSESKLRTAYLSDHSPVSAIESFTVRSI